MLPVSQVASYGDIRVEGHGHNVTFNQISQISVAEIKTRPPIATSPYRGLRRFDEVNRDYFFGRDRLVAQLLERLAQRNLVLLAGASGSGKSSAVRAGLLPQLRARLPQGRFHTLVMIPGRDPFQSLRGPLEALDVPQNRLQALDARTADSVVKTLTLQRRRDDLWLLFVDQFEQVFTLCAEPAWREAFLTGLTRLAEASQSEIKIVLAMRADFFDRFGPYPEFAALAQQGIQLAVDMQASELRAAIEQPAARHGMVFEEGLVEQIIAHLKGQPGALPLLQYTLDLLWTADNPVDDRTLNTKSYNLIGGIEGALQQRADALYYYTDVDAETERSQQQKEAMRRIFLRLVDMASSGAESRAVSRPTPLAHFTTPEEQQLISELVEEKLLVSDALVQPGIESSHAGATIEIAHEALLSAWLTLKGWIEQAREVLYVRNRLAADSLHFGQVKADAPDRAADELWGGTRLQQALELRARGDFTALLGGLRPEEEAFLTASADKKRAEEAAKAEAEQKLKDAYERVNQQLLSTYVEQGRKFLFEQQSPGEALLWLHRAQARGSMHPGLADLLKSALTSVGVGHVLLTGHEWQVASGTYSPDGRRIVTASRDHTARVWEAETGRLLATLEGHGDSVDSAAFSPDGRCIVTASRDHTARVWEAETGRLLAELKGHEACVNRAAFSPDGRCIVTASDDGSARKWDAETGRLLAELKGHADLVHTATYSPDGGRIVTASDDKTARIWEAATGILIAELKGHESGVTSTTSSPDGRSIVTASRDHTARVWEAETGSLTAELKGHWGIVNSATYSPDGCRIVTASGDHTARVWEAETGDLLAELKGHSDSVESASFGPDGRHITTASSDHTARLWIVEPGHRIAGLWIADTGRLLAELKGHADIVNSATFSPDGRRIITASNDKTVRVWEAALSRQVTEIKVSTQSAIYSPDGCHIITPAGGRLDFHSAQTGSFDFSLWDYSTSPFRFESVTCSSDGRRIVAVTGDNAIQIWDVTRRQLCEEIKDAEPFGRIIFVTYSPIGRSFITVSNNGTTRLWTECIGPGSSWVPGGTFGSSKSASFSPDGQRIVTVNNDRMVRVWKGTSQIAEFGHQYNVHSAAFSPDGRRIVTASEDKSARVWELDSGRLLAEFRGHKASVRGATYSPDGHRIVTASADGTARVWEAETGRLLAEFLGHIGPVLSASYSPDGLRIITLGADALVRVWDMSAETRTASEIAQFIRCYVPFRFERDDCDVLVPAVPDPMGCQGGNLPTS